MFRYLSISAVLAFGTYVLEVSAAELAQGHQQFQQLNEQHFPEAYAQLTFDSAEVAETRAALAGNLLTYRTSNDYGSNSGGYSATEQYLFCTNGTFQMSSNSSLIVDSGEASGYSADEQSMQGVWDVASSNGLTFLWMYSQSPYMIEQLSNTGFFAFPLRSIDIDVISFHAGPSEPPILLRREHYAEC